MIIGIGTDLCNITRLERTLTRFGDKFENRVYAPQEQAAARTRANPAATYAKRWAAKEACVKALGTGVKMGISWKDMVVSNLDTGQPVITLMRWAHARLEQITPANHAARIHLSITDDFPWAQAFVVIEAYPCVTINHRDDTGV